MLNRFYEIKDIERQQAEGVVSAELNPGHALYAGHSPGMPVVPGVCTLMLVKESLEKLTGKGWTYRYLQSCKFLAVIHPEKDRNLTLTLKWQEETTGETRLQASVSTAETTVLKLRAVLTLQDKRPDSSSLVK